MIPILYESNEISFDNNGLGRLRDIIDCRVTEERNGVFECDFSYPVTGRNYEEIQPERIILVEHDDTGRAEPFDIKSKSEPINGVVEFHAVHISYRLRGVTVSAKNINSLADALTACAGGVPANLFTFDTDKTSTGYCAAFDGVPRSVRSILGGVEGSILDAYGGEYEFIGWNVYLHANRGVTRDFSVRYGVNLIDYTNEEDYSETFTAVIPYWQAEDTVVKGGMIQSGQYGPSGREICVPLDLSDKFETQPTVAQLESMAASVLASKQPWLPEQTISVNFIRLQDTPEYAHLAPLLECRLCDRIRVVMPMYHTEGYFKIVKVVWDVLQERYTEMELGNLSTTLADALGISEGTTNATNIADYVTGYGSNNDGWYWRKWNSGKCEAWGNFQFSGITVTTPNAGTYWGNGGFKDLSLPSSLFTSVDCAEVTNGQGTHASGVYPYAVNSLTTTAVQIQFRAFASSSSVGCPAFVKVYGSWR